MSVTERLAHSGMLPLSLSGGEYHENDLRGDGPCFRVHDRHGRDHDHCADRVMRDLLIFLGRGFALFAGGPAVLDAYPLLRRRTATVRAPDR